jgi:hypothetical protein
MSISGFDGSVCIDSQTIPNSNYAWIWHKKNTLETVTAGANVKKVVVVIDKVRSERTGQVMIYGILSPHRRPALAFKTKNTAEGEFITQPRPVTPIIRPSGRPMATLVWFFRVGIRLWI